MSRIYLAAALFLLMMTGVMTSCSNDGRDYSNSEVILIEKDSLKTINSWEFSEVYNNVEIIPLQTSSESLFAKVSQAIVDDSYIYVLARFSARSMEAKVMQFKKDGSFVRQIGTIGEGPGEYLSIDQIVLVNDTLFAFESQKRCVHAYEPTTGTYLKSSPKGEYQPLMSLNSVIWNPKKNNFLFTSDVIFGNNRYSLAEGNPLNGTFNILMPPCFSVEGWISYGYGTTTLCDLDGRNAVTILPLDKTVYRIDYATGETTPFCDIFPQEKMPEFKPMENYEVAQQTAFEAKVLSLTGVFATKDYLVVNLDFGSVVWNLDTSQGFYTLNGWNMEGTPGFPFFPAHIVGTDSKNNTFVCAYDAERFIDCYAAMPEKRPYKVNAHNISQVTEDSNPVLVLYTLK